MEHLERGLQKQGTGWISEGLLSREMFGEVFVSYLSTESLGKPQGLTRSGRKPLKVKGWVNLESLCDSRNGSRLDFVG